VGARRGQPPSKRFRARSKAPVLSGLMRSTVDRALSYKEPAARQTPSAVASASAARTLLRGRSWLAGAWASGLSCATRHLALRTNRPSAPLCLGNRNDHLADRASKEPILFDIRCRQRRHQDDPHCSATSRTIGKQGRHHSGPDHYCIEPAPISPLQFDRRLIGYCKCGLVGWSGRRGLSGLAARCGSTTWSSTA
jgi:hypothetical protein